ncbi:MAG: YjbQ family protein [Planctomycetia bacterium]|nr:YjbQ family protein [Planctomycetia bacterium]
MKTLGVRTSRRDEFVDLTAQVARVVAESGVAEGACVVYVPHTTAGVTVNEHADPDVAADMLRALDRIVPWEDGYAHGEGNSAAHIKTTMVGSSSTVPVSGGKLALGTWQGIFLCEFDGPRTRQVHVQVLEA